jgi:YfiH family protein
MEHGYLEAPTPLPYARHGFGTRQNGGEIQVGLAMAEAALGLQPGAIAHMGQVHKATLKEATQGGLYPECDAIFTTQKGLWLAVKTADCTPVLVSSAKAVAAVHLGWRSTKAGLLRVVVDALTAPLGQQPQDVFIALGPSLSQPNFEVEDTFVQAFGVQNPSRFFAPSRAGHVLMDLGGIIRQQAAEAGIPAQNVQILPACTYAAPSQFYSYRKDKTNPGRQISLICRA